MSLHGVILCGGKATRFNGKIKGLLDIPTGPKLGTIDGYVQPSKKLIELQIREMKENNIDCIWLATQYGAWTYKEWLNKNGDKLGIHVDIIDEKIPLGTGGAMKNAIQYIKQTHYFKKDQTFVFYNGDIIHNDFMLLNKLLARHVTTGQNVLAGFKVPAVDAKQYGQIQTKNNRIVKFIEKQPSEKPVHINAGIYVINSKTLNKVKQVKFSIEKDFFEKYPKIHDMIPMADGSSWLDVGTPERYQLLQEQYRKFI